MKAFDREVKRWLFCFTHPDDEISIVAWIRRLCDAGAEVHCSWTVSNPTREAEARAMMKTLGVLQENLFFYEAPDGHACEHLPELIEFERRAIESSRPDRIAVGAFECGHLDHDSTNVAVAHANEGRVPTFEIPFYHTYLTRIPVINRFADPAGEEIIELTPDEQKLKVSASRMYRSQNIGSLLLLYTILNWVKLSPAALCRTERMRRQTHFDYQAPNLPPRLRVKVSKSKNFQTFIRELKRQGDSWRVIDDPFIPVFASEIRRLVPQINPVSEDDDGVYIWAGELSIFFRENLDNNEIVKNCIEFINQACERGSWETWEVIWIEFFEIAEAMPIRTLFETELRGKAADRFEEYREWQLAGDT